ncbi:MAG: NADH:flavin oxidoreductase [Desulfobacterales bacterium]|jgi:2,4-dienoyl-CoA reductase-like NADH-dependent reductase (Old Yellow Enzyme family)|nr:NADH:flavin oxidoreductase [Desulfobacterales bacterium]
MSKLFETETINSMRLSNRFVRSATWEGCAFEDGECSPKLVEMMAELAAGEVGLIITGHAYIRPDGKAGIGQLGIYKDELIPGLQKMVEAVHRRGGRIVMQLAHAGCFTHSNLTGLMPMAVSHTEKYTTETHKDLSQDDINELVSAFSHASRRAQKAGFDGVEIHGAHGYLLSQFLAPRYNKRTDKYGGSIESRARILLEIVTAIREVTGPGYPILIKMNSEDFWAGGMTLEESVRVGEMLVEASLDAIELSGGTLGSGKLIPSRLGISSPDKEAYFQEAAMVFKKKINIPVILVGGIRSFDVAERLVVNGVADLISMSRPFIREPKLIKRWKTGDRNKAACESDNLCFQPAIEGKGICCVVEERLRNKVLNSPR